MVSYPITGSSTKYQYVLILIVMDNGLLPPLQ